MSTFVVVITAVLILFIRYFLVIRPWQVRWGATDEDSGSPITG